MRETRGAMIRVTVPIDLNAVCTSGCAAFALATPLRIADLLVLAVQAALGPRAPSDKRERTLRHTTRGFEDGRFLIDVDGHVYSRLDDVVVCSGTVTLRFFLQREVRSPL